MYYIFVKDNKIDGKGQCKCLNEDILNFEVPEDIYNNSEKYIFKYGQLILDPDFEEKEKQKERERLDKLFLTGADVERGIYQAKGMDFDDIIELVTQLQAQEVSQKGEPIALDVKALKIELKANNFYRGNPYVNAVGALLGFSIEQLDRFFETKDYKELLPVEDEIIDEIITNTNAYSYDDI